jgi:hypothetical protein
MKGSCPSVRIHSERSFVLNWIKSESFISFDDGTAVVVAFVEADTVEDLPAPDGIRGRILAKGSVAHDINTGDYYCLNSLGTWKKQKTAEVLGTSVASMLMAARAGESIFGELTVEEER